MIVCATCRWSVPPKVDLRMEPDDLAAYFCYLNPPTVLWIESAAAWETVHPLVRALTFCSHWAPREDPS